MEKMNHIKMIERFFEALNDKYYTSIDLDNVYTYKTEKRQFSNIGFSKNCKVFIRNCLPYTITKLKSGKYIFLNREYKPLGVFGYSKTVDYEDFEFLAFDYKDNIDGIYFHSDSNRPQDSKKDYVDYLIRLKRFLVDYKNNEINIEDKNFYKYS